MGFFSKLFKKSPADRCVSFLNEADAAYSRAFQIKNASGLERYFDRACLTVIVEKIRMAQKVYSGIDRYKVVTWDKVNDSCYIKKVRYKDVEISKGIKAPVGDSYDEEWCVMINGADFRVTNLRRLVV